MSRHVVTGISRLSYVNLFRPRANQNGGEPKYGVTVLVPKSDTATKGRIDAAIAAAVEYGKERFWNGVAPPQVPTNVHDGDGVRPSDGRPFGDECKGCWVFTATTKDPPKVVDAQLNPIIDQTQVYSGMYGCVSVDFFPYGGKNGIKVGVSCALVNVQKLADGEPLAGQRSTPEEDFQAVMDAQQAPPAQNYGQTTSAAPAQNYGQNQQAPPNVNPLTGEIMPG